MSVYYRDKTIEILGSDYAWLYISHFAKLPTSKLRNKGHAGTIQRALIDQSQCLIINQMVGAGEDHC